MAKMKLDEDLDLKSIDQAFDMLDIPDICIPLTFVYHDLALLNQMNGETTKEQISEPKHWVGDTMRILSSPEHSRLFFCKQMLL